LYFNNHLLKMDRIYYFFFFIFMIGTNIHANAGVPMLFVMYPTMLISLIPIILIESVIFLNHLDVSFYEVIKASLVANLFSTIIGVPLTWALLLIFQMITGGSSGYGLTTFSKKLYSVTFQAPWLIPYNKNLYWMIPSAALFLLIPFFFVSWFSEYYLVKYFFVEINSLKLNNMVFFSNLVTYSLLSFLTLCLLIYRVVKGEPPTDNDDFTDL
jgi:hypothetical protein